MRLLLSVVAIPVALLLTCACVPKVTSTRTAPEYALDDFRGPEGMPFAPEGTRLGVDLAGWWRVTAARRRDGSATADHLFEPDVHMRIAQSAIDNIQGIAASRLLPIQPEWSINRSDFNGVTLGFGFETQSQALRFLHYGFAMRATDGDRALATEALHYAEAGSGVPVWGIWEIELERVVISGPEGLAEGASPLRMRWLR